MASNIWERHLFSRFSSVFRNPCHKSGIHSLAAHSRGPGSIPAPSAWDFWWTQCHWNLFIFRPSSVFSFSHCPSTKFIIFLYYFFSEGKAGEASESANKSMLFLIWGNIDIYCVNVVYILLRVSIVVQGRSLGKRNAAFKAANNLSCLSICQKKKLEGWDSFGVPKELPGWCIDLQVIRVLDSTVISLIWNSLVTFGSVTYKHAL